MAVEIENNKRLLLPKIDVIFKLLFGDMRNADIMIDFLQSILTLSEDEYTEITIIDPHLKRETTEDKLGIVDVRINTKSGKIIIIEIQIIEQDEMPERAVYYNAKSLVTQIKSGEDYSVLEKTITIVIADFEIIKDSPNYHHVFQLYDKQTTKRFTDIIEIDTLELKKIPKESDNTKKYAWMRFLKAEKEEEFQMLAEKHPIIEKAYVELKRLSQDEEAQLIYEAREKALRDERARYKTALNKGLAEGLAKGKAEGLAKGKAEGLAKGKAEGIKETAKNFLKLGLTVEQVIAGTGLSAEEIEVLKIT